MALNTEFLVKMPISQKLLALGALVALMVLGYYFFAYSPLKEQYDAKQDTLSKKRSELAKLETVEKDKEKLDRELKEKERKLEKAKEKLPTETEMERLFLDINDLGQQNGIAFSDFKPQKEASQGDLYIEVPIQLKFTGTYRYAMNFFYKVTHLSRIVNFKGVSIKGKKAKGSEAFEIEVDCTATTYKFMGK